MANRHRAEWLADGSYGIMVHYLISPPGDTEAERSKAFNDTVDNFDLPYFMDQFEAAKADWLIFTIGQNTGYYCSSNEMFDRLLPGHTSKRDMIKEIAGAVHKMGKKFIAYLPAEVDMAPYGIADAFSWEDDRRPFLKKYLEFVRTYSLKFGGLVDGWWFDGCYDHIHNFKWDWQDWADAVRAGNPESIMALNDGAFCVGRLKPLSPLQDYHAGEVHMLEDGKIRLDFIDTEAEITPDGKVRKAGQTEVSLYMPDSQYTDGVQWHALVPVDCTFNPFVPDMHYSDDELYRFVSGCKTVKGAVTLNLPIDTSNGHIPTASAEQMKRLGEMLMAG